MFSSNSIRLVSGCLFLSLAACSQAPAVDGTPAGSGGKIGGGTGGASGGSSGQGGKPASGGGGGTAPSGSGGQSGSSPGTTGGNSGAAGGGGGGTDGGSNPAGTGGTTGADANSGGDASGVDPGALPKFSFFVTSLASMQKLSGNPMGFGGDLTFGKADGLSGADEICRQIAEIGMPGAGQKQWRAFLSTTAGGPNGGPVHAKDRLGDGPWYDRVGRLVAMNKTDLINVRPKGADPKIINDLPNEFGIPNHAPDPGKGQVDNHDMLTGTNPQGMLYSMNKASTCNDWTNKTMTGKPWCGHSWPRLGSGVNWMSALAEGGCAPGVNLLEQGGPRAPNVGSGGGYGGIYCFASTP
jgi:hypothetical protein